MTETLLRRGEAAEYIRKNADPVCHLDNIDRRDLHRWHIDDYGPIPEVIDGIWCYLREELDDFIEIQGLMAKGLIKP